MMNEVLNNILSRRDIFQNEIVTISELGRETCLLGCSR